MQLRHLQTLQPSRSSDRGSLRPGDRNDGHRDARQPALARGLHRPPFADPHRGGAGQQHRPAIGAVARRRGRGHPQVGASVVPALVQLGSSRGREQLRQLEGFVDLQHTRYGQLGDRHLQSSAQQQTAREGSLRSERRVPSGRADAADRRHRQLLLHAADARRAVRHHGRNGRELAPERGDDARDEGGRHDHAGRRIPERSDLLFGGQLAQGPRAVDPRDGERLLRASGKRRAQHRARHDRRTTDPRRARRGCPRADALEPSRRTFGRVDAHVGLLRDGCGPFGALPEPHAQRYGGVDQ